MAKGGRREATGREEGEQTGVTWKDSQRAADVAAAEERRLAREERERRKRADD